jgi:hypothetical protein
LSEKPLPVRLALEAFFDIISRSKVKHMDARTVLILGLGVIVLLLLGFCALPM